MPIRSPRPIYLLVAVLFCIQPLFALADDATERQAIESAAQQWVRAFNQRDAAALGTLATEDVVVLGGGSSRVAGSKNARDVWLRSASIAGGKVKSVSKEIVVSGDAAWRVGVVTYHPTGGEQHTGESLEIWMRTRDGWRLHRQMSSLISDLLPRSAPSEPALDRPSN